MTNNASSPDRKNPTANPISDILANRWSPYGFADRSVSDEDLRSVFEAARWAPSCYGDEPWYYIVARREDRDEFARLLSCLMEANQVWARHAPVLALGVARTTFAHNNKPNRHALHDLGQSSAHLTFEAEARGLKVHQMAGLNPSKAKQTYGVPDNCEVVTALAIGYAGDGADLPDEMRARDHRERARRPLSETVFIGAWGRLHPIINE